MDLLIPVVSFQTRINSYYERWIYLPPQIINSYPSKAAAALKVNSWFQMDLHLCILISIQRYHGNFCHSLVGQSWCHTDALYVHFFL